MGEISTEKFDRQHFDYWLLFVTILLVALGIIMVYSSSGMLSRDTYGDGYYFLKKELMFVVVGFALMFAALKIDYHIYRRLMYPLFGLMFVGILLAFIPGFKTVAAGAARWVSIAGVRFQPSEFAKLVMIIFMAYSLEKKAKRMDTLTVGYLSHVVIAGTVMLIILMQRDFGAAATIGLIVGVMMFIGGVRLRYVGVSILACLPALYFMVLSVGYRRQRILAFLDPWSDRYGSGFQIIQSLVSFNQGGVFGSGLGEGQQKLFYLPEAHTDFIVSVLGEELGLLGMGLVIILFAAFCYRGFKTYTSAPDLFGKYLALGITMFITLQALFNLSVAMGLLPTKGMVLPFISYGGTALLVMLLSVGILLNISSFKKGPLCGA